MMESVPGARCPVPGAAGAGGAGGGHAVGVDDVLDPQVSERASRRTYTARYKLDATARTGARIPRRLASRSRSAHDPADSR